jgi:hypothetical protein
MIIFNARPGTGAAPTGLRLFIELRIRTFVMTGFAESKKPLGLAAVFCLLTCSVCTAEDDLLTPVSLRAFEAFEAESQSESLRERLPEIYNALKEWTEFVNQRYIEDGKQAVLNLIFL